MGKNQQYFCIGSDNDSVSTRRQGIIWTNDGKFTDTRPQWNICDV